MEGFYFLKKIMSLHIDMISSIVPLSDRVLLRPVSADNITASGIILPESANKERPSLYEVLAFGPGKVDKNGNLVTIELKKGDRVITGQYSGDDISVGDVTFKIVAYEYILAKLSA